MKRIFLFQVIISLCIIIFSCGLERPFKVFPPAVYVNPFIFDNQTDHRDVPGLIEFTGYIAYYRIGPDSGFSAHGDHHSVADLQSDPDFHKLYSDTATTTDNDRVLYVTDNITEENIVPNPTRFTFDFSNPDDPTMMSDKDPGNAVKLRRAVPDNLPAADYKRFSEFAVGDTDIDNSLLPVPNNGATFTVTIELYVFCAGKSLNSQTFGKDIYSPVKHLLYNIVTLKYDDGT